MSGPLLSAWRTVSQDLIDRFADAIGDRQFIHVDPVRAAATPLGGTVAHGFLTLSLLGAMLEEAAPVPPGARMVLNYGFDRVRFLAPVPSGARIRGRFSPGERSPRGPGEVLIRHAVEVEIEGAARPALAADWLVLALYGPEGTP